MLVKLQHNYLHIYEEWQSFHKRFFFFLHLFIASVGWLHMIETMDGLTEQTNVVKIDLGKQGNTVLLSFFHINN